VSSNAASTADGTVVVVRADPRRRPRRADVPWRRVLTGVVVAAVVGGLLVATAGTLVSQRIAEWLAVRNATTDTATLARAVIEPALDDAIADETADAAERTAARDRLATAVDHALPGDTAVRVKVWDRDGTILWSDEPRLVGERFTLSGDDLDALLTDESDAEVSDLDEPENRYERGDGPLLEAYQAVHTPSGRPLLFEVYYRYDDVLASATRLRSAFAGLAFGTVGVVLVLLVPVLLWLLVRIRDGQRERERLLVRALDAQAEERRRLAAELHDGAVQDVAGLAMSLGAAGDPALREAAGTLRGAVSSLRSSLSAIRPAAPEQDGLGRALDDACARARSVGLETVLRVPDPVTASPAALHAVVRFVREAVANTVVHARATTVRVTITSTPVELVVAVSDDGVGFEADSVLAQQRDGHLGTTILRQHAIDVGGSLTLRTAPGAGTTWELRVPTDTEAIA
jgi:signal transduction histidine kinase